VLEEEYNAPLNDTMNGLLNWAEPEKVFFSLHGASSKQPAIRKGRLKEARGSMRAWCFMDEA
jgi:hypothetical protein